MTVLTENRRSFHQLDELCRTPFYDVVVVNSLSTLGLTNNDAAVRLERFAQSQTALIIAEIHATYERGTDKTINHIVLGAILQTILLKDKEAHVLSYKRGNSGRKRVQFPENWDKLYIQWVNKEISSKEFIEATGLKKATFYNLITEYRQLLDQNERWSERYKQA